MTVARIEQLPVRVVSTTNPAARAEQLVIRVVSREQVFARTEQVTVRVVSSNVPDDGGASETPVQLGDRYFASVPTYALQIACLELDHPEWEAPHRRVIQPDDWTVTIEVDVAGVPTPTAVTFPGWDETGPWFGEFPGADEQSRAVRTLSLDDPANALLALIESVAESEEPVRVRLWLFRSDVLDEPLIVEQYEVQAVAPDAERLELACIGRDLSALVDPVLRFTRANTPGLRGR